MDKDNLSELETIWDEAREYIKKGLVEKAVEIYKYILLRYADDPVASEYANIYLGEIYLDLKQFDLAEKYIKAAINYQPEKAAYHYLLGFLFSYQHQWDQAIAEFSAALSCEPQNEECVRGLGWAIFQNGDRSKGLELLLQAHEMVPENINIMIDLAVAYLAVDFNEARKYAEQAVAAEPDNALAQRVLNTVREAEHDISRIIQEMQIGSENKWYYDYDAKQIYQFKVSLKDNPDIWRIIEIKGTQLLSTLHKGIMAAFDREEERPYSFFFDSRLNDRHFEFASTIPGISDSARPARSIKVDSILLYQDEDEKFRYLYDYENQCWHEIEIIKIVFRKSQAKFPRVVKKQGKYPVKSKKKA